jgi:predicted DNA-binding antitoxin AbrB/MazE fold protein
MVQTIDAIFDGKVLVPQNGVQLLEGKRYKLIVQPVEQSAASSESAWDLLGQLVGTVEGPADWASEIDHYLYGTPKRNPANEQ